MMLLMGGTVIGLLIGEFGIRLFDIGPQFTPIWAGNYRLSENPILRYELVPGSRYEDGFINAHGMQDRPRVVSKPPHTTRIACIGDSICFGVGEGQSASIPARLEEYLQRYFATQDRSYEVLNFGVTGYNISQIMENLRVRAIPFHPDLIVYIYCLNDPQRYSLEFSGLASQLTAPQHRYRDALISRGRSMASKSRLYLLSRYMFDTLAAAMHDGADPENERAATKAIRGTTVGHVRALHQSEIGWKRVTDGLDVLRDTADRLGIPAVVVIVPLIQDLDAYPLRDIHDRVIAAARARSLPVVDLQPSYEALYRVAGRAFAAEIIHPNEQGYTYTAVVILRAMIAAHWAGDGRSFATMMGADTTESDIAAFIEEHVALDSELHGIP